MFAALLLAGIAAAYLVFEPVQTSGTGADPVRSDGHLLMLPSPSPAPGLAPLSPGGAKGLTQSIVNPLEISGDLRKVYERFKDSTDALERHIAYRAWSACFPTFIAPQGQAVSIESLTRSFAGDAPQGVLRTEAYRALLGRCLKFSDLTREDALTSTRLQQQLADHGLALSPGEQATQSLIGGNRQEALRLAREIIASQDPYAISSLSEFIKTMIVLQVDAQILPSTERADLRSMAFTLAACQMGLECGSESLSALQMCIGLGTCSGSVTDRYLQALPSEADRAALNVETQRVLQDIRSLNFTVLGL